MMGAFLSALMLVGRLLGLKEPLPPMADGEIYFVSSGHRYYLDMKRPAAAKVAYITGNIESYVVVTEGETDIPYAAIGFIPDRRGDYGGVVNVAQPPIVNGHIYACPANTSSPSEFVRRFATCMTPPNDVVGHHVRISLYQVSIPSGETRFATDSIETLPK